jgi:hypothetical protein
MKARSSLLTPARVFQLKQGFFIGGSMTIKEIAELTNAGESSVRRWMSTAKMADRYTAKMAESKRTHRPVDLELDEAIDIMRTGGISESLISLLKENAERKHPEENRLTRLEAMVGSLVQAVRAMLTAGQKAPSLPEPEYYEVLGYSLKKGLHLSDGEISLCGRLATKISRERSYEIRKNPHPRYGEVGCYHVDILDDVFASRNAG